MTISEISDISGEKLNSVHGHKSLNLFCLTQISCCGREGNNTSVPEFKPVMFVRIVDQFLFWAKLKIPAKREAT